MRFSLLHPSRGRPRMADEVICEWLGKRSGSYDCEYVLAVDPDDSDLEEYRRVATHRGVRLIIHPNRSVVDAANRAAEVAGGDVLIVVSDDFGCPQRWDEELARVLGERRDVAVLVHDAVDGRIMTLPILGREFYERLGYVYCPEYFSLFGDDDLTETAALFGKLVDARHLVFPHNHWSRGARPRDSTDERQSSVPAWLSGWRTLQKRRLTGFGTRRRTTRTALAEIGIDAGYYTRCWGSRAKRWLLGRRAV